MPWISKERIAAAREVDLLTYLQEREPYELVRSRNARREYRTASHGSLVISNGVWFWNRGQFGSRNALDYLIKIRGMSLVEAVQAVESVGGIRASPDISPLAVKGTVERENKILSLPPQAKFPTRLLSYREHNHL
jgi:hypothetical protein